MNNELLAAIRPVKSRIEDELIAIKGVNMIDIAEKVSDGKPTGELAIVVYVDKKVPLSKLAEADKVPAEVNGIKTDVQEMVIELQPTWYPLDDAAQVDPAAYPTLVGGISMGPSRTFFLSPPEVATPGNYTFVGTFGALVKDNASGATMALSNYHVAAVDTNWTSADRQVQPGRPDGGSPATQEFGTLTRAVLSERVDGSVTTIDAGKTWSAEIQGIGNVEGSTAATVGMAVRKRGRTTELTYGSVVSVDATVSLDYGHGVGTRTLKKQVRIATDTSKSVRFSNGGDSGSVVVNDDREVIGLLFAGSTDGSTTFANPIADVLSELNVTLLTKKPPVVKPTLACAPSKLIFACPPTNLAICQKSLFVICPSKLVAFCPTKNVVCKSNLVCPTKIKIICTGWQEPFGSHEYGGPEDYGYGTSEGDDSGYGEAYQAGYADGHAAAQAEGSQSAGAEAVTAIPPSLLSCPSYLVVCPSTRFDCPTRFGCWTRFDCPTRFGCQSIVFCPTRLCPSRAFCPSLAGCPTQVCDLPIDPGPFGGEAEVPDQAFWAGYLAALEQLSGEQEQ